MVQVEAGSSLRRPMSAEEYANLGEAKFHEYYEGCLVVNPPTIRHTVAVGNLILTLAPLRQGRLVVSEAGWQIGEELFIPDLMVVDEAAISESLIVTPPPHLVVEILSPSTRSADRGKKFEAYAAGGAGWYWIIDLDQSEVAVFENRRGRFVEITTVVETALLPPMGASVDPRTLGQPS